MKKVDKPQGFQSTPPVKAATPARYKPVSSSGISIHAAREGGDGLVAATP